MSDTETRLSPLSAGSKPRMALNSAFNLMGVVIPAIVAVVATPLLLGSLGVDRFGIFSIQLAILVLLGTNDFGVSRAIVLLAIQRGGFDQEKQRLETVQAGLHLAIAFGMLILVAGIVILAAANFFHPLDTETLVSTFLVMPSATLSLVTLPLRASMEIKEEFLIINILRTVATSLLFLAPLLALSIHPTLVSAGFGLLVSRIFILFCFAVTVERKLWAGFASSFSVSVKTAMTSHFPDPHLGLLKKAGWLGSAGLISMIMTYSDRFLISMILGAAATGIYAVASELTTKLWLVIGAITVAATPRIASDWQRDEFMQVKKTLVLLSAVICLFTFSAHALLIYDTDRIFSLWLGNKFDTRMAEIAQILSIGISISCFNQVAYLLLIIAKKERECTYLQLFNFPVSLLLCIIFTKYFGIIGAAWAFTLRLMVDAIVVQVLHYRLIDKRAQLAFPFFMFLWMLLIIGTYIWKLYT